MIKYKGVGCPAHPFSPRRSALQKGYFLSNPLSEIHIKFLRFWLENRVQKNTLLFLRVLAALGGVG